MRETIIKLLESENEEDKVLGRTYLLKYYPQLIKSIIIGPWGGKKNVIQLNLSSIEPVLKYVFKKDKDKHSTWVGIIFKEEELP